MKSKPMAHTKTIMKVAWHPTQSNLLASGSRDHLVKLWDIEDMHSPQKIITNVEPVERLKWVPSSSRHPTTLLGIGSVLGDSTLSIWDVQNPFIPRHTFRTDSKNKITDFEFIPDLAVYTNKASYLVAEGFDNAPCLVDERRAHPLCCDILENYCFSYDTDSSDAGSNNKSDPFQRHQKLNRKINFFNAHLINSCYEQESKFTSQEEEMLFFVEKYKVVNGHPLRSLLLNYELCKEMGKIEIAEIWLAIHSLFFDENMDQQEISKPSPQPGDSSKQAGTVAHEKADSMVKVMNFYKKNPDRFMTDLHNQRIMFVEKEPGREPELMILENHEKALLQDIGMAYGSKDQFEELSTRQKSKAALALINELIDNGEFIHGYQIYVCLSPMMEALDPKTMRLWTGTYIDLLTSMGFYNKANYLVKHSSLEIFEGLQKKLQPMHTKCVNCKGEIESMQSGYCSKCKSTRKCGICQKTVKGLNLWCQICGHGGHFPEMKAWFTRQNASCPSGCGHVCFKFY